MPFAGYKDFADCVAKNQDKGDPEAYCAVIKRQVEGEALRHPDFEKIYQQFLNYEDGENRYWNWVTALNLDESKPYAYSQKEKLHWDRHRNFQLWKEDKHAKYWRFQAGFAVTSMNNNVYTEKELTLAARTLKGKPVNLNHKFSLPTISIEASDYDFQEGLVEGIIRVPNNLRCPICDKTKTINDLIESGGIYNNSLEAGCEYKPDTDAPPGICEGMSFEGLAMLTVKTLPGIPLTRYLPLESIMVEALQVDETYAKRRRRNVKKIEMKIFEEIDKVLPGSRYCDEHPDDPRCKEHQKSIHGEQATADQDCPEGKIWNPRTGECEAEPPAEQVTTPDHTDTTGPGMRQLKPKSVQPDENGQCPDGYILSTQLGNCILDESCPEGQHFDQDEQRCMPDTVPKSAEPATAVGTSPAPKETANPDDVVHDTTGGIDPHERPMPMAEPAPTTSKDVIVPKASTPEDQPSSLPAEKPISKPEPKPPHTCPDGHHYDYDANQCVPDQPIVERVKRIKAEMRAKNAEEQVANWELYYVQLDEKYQQLRGTCREQRHRITSLENQADQHRKDLVEAQVARDKMIRLRDEAVGLRDDYQRQLEETRVKNMNLSRSYNDVLDQATKVSTKNTDLNKEILDLYAKIEMLEAKVGQARNLAKKVVKIKV